MDVGPMDHRDRRKPLVRERVAVVKRRPLHGTARATVRAEGRWLCTMYLERW